jgi:hypothetical protein
VAKPTVCAAADAAMKLPAKRQTSLNMLSSSKELSRYISRG